MYLAGIWTKDLSVWMQVLSWLTQQNLEEQFNI